MPVNTATISIYAIDIKRFCIAIYESRHCERLKASWQSIKIKSLDFMESLELLKDSAESPYDYAPSKIFMFYYGLLRALPSQRRKRVDCFKSLRSLAKTVKGRIAKAKENAPQRR